MPYLDPRRKGDIDKGMLAKTSGELNYALTSLLTEYLETNGLSYSSINDVIGALEGAKLEFYRRVAAPYEGKKMRQNGDVYPAELLTKKGEIFNAK